MGWPTPSSCRRPSKLLLILAGAAASSASCSPHVGAGGSPPAGSCPPCGRPPTACDCRSQPSRAGPLGRRLGDGDPGVHRRPRGLGPCIRRRRRDRRDRSRLLGRRSIAAVSPTPGGLGAIEAALVAGLTGVGMHARPACRRYSFTGWPPTGCRSCPDGSPGNLAKARLCIGQYGARVRRRDPAGCERAKPPRPPWA